jgi:hypothetical protein
MTAVIDCASADIVKSPPLEYSERSFYNRENLMGGGVRMVALFKEYIFDFKDLRLSIMCGVCGAEIIVDLANSSSRVMEKCTACRNQFDEQFTQGLIDFQSAYLALASKTKRSVSARIRVQDNQGLDVERK